MLWSEPRGVYSMLQVAWARGIRRIIVESDSPVAVNLINGSGERSHPYASLVL